MRRRAKRKKGKEMMLVAGICGVSFLSIFFITLFLGFIPSIFLAGIPTAIVAESLQRRFKLTAQELAGAVTLGVVGLFLTWMVVLMVR